MAITLANAPFPFVGYGAINKSLPYGAQLQKPQPTLSGDSNPTWTAVITWGIWNAHQTVNLGGQLYDAGTAFSVFCSGLIYSIGGANRVIPLAHPNYQSLLARSIKQQYRGSIQANGLYPNCETTVTFTSRPYPTDGSTAFLTIEKAFSSKEHALAGTSLVMEGDGSAIQQDASFPVPEIAYALTIHQAVGMGSNVEAAAAAAPVNSVPVTIGPDTWPAGMVKFEGCAAKSTMSSSFIQTFERSLRLTYRPIDWNKFLRKDGVWDFAKKPDNTHVYATSDLNALFQ